MLDMLRRFLPARLRSDAPVIPVIRLAGPIGTGGSRFAPSISMASAAGPLEQAFGVKSAPAVAIIINSPGGSAAQSRLIWKRIRDLAAEKDKKVLFFVEDAAASGGYMIACAGDEIIADPCSIIGSIGVVAATFGFQDLIAKVGVERRVYTAGENKVTLDPFKPEKAEDVEKLNTLLGDLHGVFIDLVKTSRGTRLKDDPELFSGSYWIAGKALERGLIDGIGDVRSVIKARYGDKARLKLIGGQRGWLARRFGMSSGFGPEAGAAIGSGLADEALARAEAAALWGRIGLSPQ